MVGDGVRDFDSRNFRGRLFAFDSKGVVPLGGKIDLGGSCVRVGEGGCVVDGLAVLIVLILFLILMDVFLGDDGEFELFRRLGGSRRPGGGGWSRDWNLFRICFCRSGRQLDDGVRGSGRRRALFIAISKFTIARGLFWISGLGVDALQCATADSGLTKTLRPRVKGGESLVQ